jgi:type II secretion system protein N
VAVKSPKHAVRLGYLAFGLSSFLVSLYCTFPAQVVTMRLAQEVARATGGQVRFQVAQADLWRFSGLAARQVRLQVGDNAPVTVDAARIRLRLLPLLLLRASVYAQVQLGNGLAEVVLALDKSHAADLRLDGIDLTKPAWLARQLGVPMQGILSGTASLTNVPRWPMVSGEVALELDRLSFGPTTVEGVGLPQIGLGNVDLEVNVAEGQAKIASLRQQGGNVQLETRGKVVLGEPIEASVLDVCGRIKVEPAFLQANPKLAAALHLAEVQLKRDANGFLNVPLAGSLRAPQLRPGLCPAR